MEVGGSWELLLTTKPPATASLGRQSGVLSMVCPCQDSSQDIAERAGRAGLCGSQISPVLWPLPGSLSLSFPFLSPIPNVFKPDHSEPTQRTLWIPGSPD